MKVRLQNDYWWMFNYAEVLDYKEEGLYQEFEVELLLDPEDRVFTEREHEAIVYGLGETSETVVKIRLDNGKTTIVPINTLRHKELTRDFTVEFLFPEGIKTKVYLQDLAFECEAIELAMAKVKLRGIDIPIECKIEAYPDNLVN